MFSSIEITNFRGFRHLVIPALAQVNLITGKNNTGKTALLEAIYWLAAGAQSEAQHFPNALRTSAGWDQQQNFWPWLFHNKDAQNELEIKARRDDGSYEFIRGSSSQPRYDPGTDTQPKIFAQSNGTFFWRTTTERQRAKSAVSLFSTRPTTPQEDARAYSEVILRPGGEEKVEALLREVEPRLKKLRPVQRQNMQSPLMYADVGLAELIPTTQLGQGFTRLMSIFAALISANSRLCVIDEIENGLHHSILCDVWKGLQTVADRQNVQIVATTHSWECVVAAHEVFSKNPHYDFALHRLERTDDGDINVITLGRESLDVADSGEWEVR